MVGALAGFTATASANELAPRDAAGGNESYSALLDFVQKIGGDKPQLIAAESPHGTAENPHGPMKAGQGDAQHDDYMALVEFAEQLSGSAKAPHAKMAQAEPKAAKPKAKAKPKAAPVVSGDLDATYVGEKACLTCHADAAKTYSQTMMGKVAKSSPGQLGCESCHGPGSAHVKAGGGRGVGGMITFRKDDPRRSVAENNAICLGCHEKGDRTLWNGSTHDTRDVACTNCHTVMRNVTPKFQLAKTTEVETCAQCHKNKRAEVWRSAHMPVREGKMTCSNCHSPHGSFGESLLKEATVNDTCYKCHAEKRGPYLWEHAPVRENCLNCHDPHGSVNDFMLKVSRPRLCQQCHANLTGHPGNPRNPLSLYAINRECQNCHSQHHGSNSPSGSRFIR